MAQCDRRFARIAPVPAQVGAGGRLSGMQPDEYQDGVSAGSLVRARRR